MSDNTQQKSIGARLLKIWQRLNKWPGGPWLFSRLVDWRVPYSGSIKARVQVLQSGYCSLQLRERRAVRNHLHSVHAVALVNLGELCSGLALMSGMPDNARGIVKGLHCDYRKKARGVLVAQCQCAIPTVSGDMDYQVRAEICDEQKEVVAIVTVDWRLGLKQ